MPSFTFCFDCLTGNLSSVNRNYDGAPYGVISCLKLCVFRQKRKVLIQGISLQFRFRLDMIATNSLGSAKLWTT